MYLRNADHFPPHDQNPPIVRHDQSRHPNQVPHGDWTRIRIARIGRYPPSHLPFCLLPEYATAVSDATAAASAEDSSSSPHLFAQPPSPQPVKVLVLHGYQSLDRPSTNQHHRNLPSDFVVEVLLSETVRPTPTLHLPSTSAVQSNPCRNPATPSSNLMRPAVQPLLVCPPIN
jgi:hypothetical protein